MTSGTPQETASGMAPVNRSRWYHDPALHAVHRNDRRDCIISTMSLVPMLRCTSSPSMLSIAGGGLRVMTTTSTRPSEARRRRSSSSRSFAEYPRATPTTNTVGRPVEGRSARRHGTVSRRWRSGCTIGLSPMTSPAALASPRVCATRSTRFAFDVSNRSRDVDRTTRSTPGRDLGTVRISVTRFSNCSWKSGQQSSRCAGTHAVMRTPGHAVMSAWAIPVMTSVCIGSRCTIHTSWTAS